MDFKRKLILSVLTLLLFIVSGACAYGIQMYSDASDTVAGVYQSLSRTSTKREQTVCIDAQEPFSILLMGIDTGDMGRTEQGRSDTTMVVTINPKEKKSTMISLSRDILTEIVGNDTNDKLNHAYAFGGETMAIETVENLLDIPVDNYVSINMQGLKDLIDAVGGIQVNNTVGAFSLDGVSVPAGELTLDGTTGLAYARMRKEDPEGDIGRQRRQREVVEKIVNKVISFDGLAKYKAILEAVKENVKTDLTWDDMIDIQKKYMPAFKTIDTLQLEGEDQQIEGIYYQLLDPTELYTVQTKLRKQLGLSENKDMLTEVQRVYGEQYEQYTDTYYEDTTGYGGYGFYPSNEYDSYVEDPDVYYDAQYIEPVADAY